MGLWSWVALPAVQTSGHCTDSHCIDSLTVKESDPLQLVCKPEGRHALLVASTHSGAAKAAYGGRERGREIKRHNDTDRQGK